MTANVPDAELERVLNECSREGWMCAEKFRNQPTSAGVETTTLVWLRYDNWGEKA